MARGLPVQPLWRSTLFEEKLRKAIPISFGIHVALIAISLIGPWRSGPIVTATVQYVSVITLPPAGMPGGGSAPDPKQPVLTPPPPAEAPKPAEMSVPDESAKPKAPESPSEARKKALEDAAADAARKKALQQLLARSQQAPPAAAPGAGEGTGNGGIPGGSLTGNPAAAPYEVLVRAAIEQNWLPPKWILQQKKTLVCAVHVTIGYDGRIVTSTLEQRSGDFAYDASAMAAVRNTERLPLPPEEIRDALLRQGLTLRFNPQSKFE